MEDIVKFWHNFLPTSTEAVVGMGASMLGGIASTVMSWGAPIETLITAMTVDYITGIIGAYRYKRRHPKSRKGLDSKKGAVGIAKKVAMLAVVWFSHSMSVDLGLPAVYTVVAWFYVGIEGLSIVENAAKCGVQIPKKLQDTLEQLTNEKDEARGRN